MTASSIGDEGRRLADWLAIAVVALASVAVLFTFRDYGLSWDDYTHAQYGDLLLSLYGSGLADKRAFSFVNLYMYGGGYDMLAALAAKISPFTLFETRRLLGGALGVITFVVTWRLGRRVAGPWAGLFGLVLLAACPVFYGHMFMNPKDPPFALAVAVFLLGFSRAIEAYPSPSPATLALVGIGIGLTIGSRIAGGIVVVFAAIALLFVLSSDTRALGVRPALARITRFAVTLLPAAVLGYLIMGLIWPWGVIDPLNPIRAADYFSVFFEKPWKELFGGALIAVPDMPRNYLLTLFALKLPILMSLLGCAGSAFALVSVFRPGPVQRRAVLLFLCAAALLPVALTFILRPAMYNGVRHFLFVLPPFAVLGGFAADAGLRSIRHQTVLLRGGAGALAMAGLALPIVEMVRLHPYQYTHFNMLAGGVRNADTSYMLDYWGLSFKEASDQLLAYLNREKLTRPPGRKWRIVACGPHPPVAVELGPDFELTWDPSGADFALMLGEFYCVDLQAPVIGEAVREGVVYARVYDIRGREVNRIFTIPPP